MVHEGSVFGVRRSGICSRREEEMRSLRETDKIPSVEREEDGADRNLPDGAGESPDAKGPKRQLILLHTPHFYFTVLLQLSMYLLYSEYWTYTLTSMHSSYLYLLSQEMN